MTDKDILQINMPTWCVVKDISNKSRDLSRKKLNQSNHKRNVALFLIQICTKNTGNLQFTLFCVSWIRVEYGVQYFELKGLNDIWLSLKLQKQLYEKERKLFSVPHQLN